MAIDIKTEVEHALNVAALVAASPAAQILLGFTGLPPAVMAKAGEFLQTLDAEFAQRIKPGPEPVPVPTAPAADADPKAPAITTLGPAITDGGPGSPAQ